MEKTVLRRGAGWAAAAVVAVVVIAWAAWPRPLTVEAARCRRGAITAAVAEEAETRLERDYTVAMPVGGRLLRVDLDEGESVEAGEVVARVDTFERRERLKELRARVEETRALIVGVDMEKPKPEDIEAAGIAVKRAELSALSARKALESARVNYEQEKRDYERKVELRGENSISQAELDRARTRSVTVENDCEKARLALESAQKDLEEAKVKLARLEDSIDDNEYRRAAYQAQIEQINSQIALLEDELRRSEIRSPASGPVLEIYNEDEQVLAAGTPIMKIGDLATLTVEADILSEEIERVRVGQDVELHGGALADRTVGGSVLRIYPAGFEKISSLGIEQQRVKVVVAFDNSELELRPGLRVDVRIITDRREDALLVPERALFHIEGRWHVFKVESGAARLAEVRLGLRGEEFAEVASGLEEGDLVVLNPGEDVEDGVEVSAEEVSGERRAAN